MSCKHGLGLGGVSCHDGVEDIAMLFVDLNRRRTLQRRKSPIPFGLLIELRAEFAQPGRPACADQCFVELAIARLPFVIGAGGIGRSKAV